MTRRTRFLLAAGLLCSIGIAAPALGGDAAELNILGFSEDGKVFAFEEFGVQDGSGFPYANRFYIDTATDTFLPGSPVRVRIDDEAATLSKAREQAAADGQKIIPDGELSANRGFTAAANAITEESADPHQVVLNPRPIFPPIDDRIAFKLEEVDFATPANCQGVEKIKGFRLIRFDPDKPGTSSTLNEDKAIPESRGCPLGYMLGAVQTLVPSGSPGVFAVMIAVRRHGFEGPDHRWIAVTGKI